MSEPNKYDGDSTERPGQRDTEKVWAELEPEGLEEDVSDLMPTSTERELQQAHADLTVLKKLNEGLEGRVNSLDADNLQLSAGNEWMYDAAKALCDSIVVHYESLRASGVSHNALEQINLEVSRTSKLLSKLIEDSNNKEWLQRRDDLIKTAEDARKKVEDYQKQISVLQDELEASHERTKTVDVIATERDQLQARINELEAAVKKPSGVDADEYDSISADRAILQLQVSELEQNLALKSDIFNKNAKSMANKYTESLADNAALKEVNEKLAKENSYLDHQNVTQQQIVSDNDKRWSAKFERSRTVGQRKGIAGIVGTLAASLVAGFVYFNGLDAVANEPAKPKVEYSEPVKIVPEPVFKYVNNKFVAEFGDEKYSMSLKKADEIMSEMEKSNKELSPADMKKYFSDRAGKEIRVDD